MVTRRYCEGPALDAMHKVVLEVKREQQLGNLSEKLKDSGVVHKLWMENNLTVRTGRTSAPPRSAARAPASGAMIRACGPSWMRASVMGGCWLM